jgi:multiple sugar transport system permease protein
MRLMSTPHVGAQLARSHAGMGRRVREQWLGVALIAPAILLIVALVLYPFAYNVWMSLQDVHLTRGISGFAGLDNYRYVLQWDAFWWGLFVDLVWTAASVVGQVVLGLMVAHLLNARFVGRNIARSLVILPWTVSAIAIAFVWRWMLNDLFGIVNQALMGGGIVSTPLLFFATPSSALATVIAINVWRGLPFMSLSLLGGLQSIPSELYEAARVDGATWWQELRHITLPSLQRIIAIVVVLRGIWIFNWFDLIWLTTGGGPADSTRTLPVLAYTTGFLAFRMGRAATVSVLMALVLVVFVTIMFKTVLSEDEAAG